MSETITHNFTPIMKKVLAKSRDYRVPLKRFYVYLHGQTMQMFPKLGKRGSGTFREVKWRWFAAQYVRKDGLQIPAQGIPGKVKGRKRMSGKRVTDSSRIMQDTGILRGAALGNFRIGANYLIARTPVKYAKFQNKMRRFAFITDDDTDRLRELIIDYLTGMN